MFSQVSVCLQSWGGVHPPWADPPLSRPLPGQTQTPPPRGQTNPPPADKPLRADTPPRADTASGQTPPPIRRPLHRTVRILLECILFCIILTLFSHLPLKVVYEFSIETWPYPCVLRGQAGHTDGWLTLQQTGSDTDSDSDPVPVVGS